MRRAMWVLPVLALLAALSPAEANTPLVFHCQANVTSQFTSNIIDTGWDWGIGTGGGVCKTIPASQQWDVTLTGESSSPMNPIFWAGDFFFDVSLQMTGRVSGQRVYSQSWQGVRVTCKIEPFVIQPRDRVARNLDSKVSAGWGNLQYCGPFPDPFGPDAPPPQPAPGFARVPP